MIIEQLEGKNSKKRIFFSQSSVKCFKVQSAVPNQTLMMALPVTSSMNLVYLSSSHHFI